MWKMFDEMLDCDECGGPLGPPPTFMIPPPPRPPSLVDYSSSSASNCNEEEMALKAKQAWDNDMCEAIPILDASLYSSQSLQTSAMIAVFSLLLVLVVLISSLFVWKNKRKVQNFLPCKTPTRGPHINGGLPLGGAHAVTYEDPDAHLGHRPLVMRHHHNVELLHGKGIHYPSGYPMTRSPPFLVSGSPGPDPYRSNDNVYEELGPGRDSDGESEPPMQSDDDFAEDELSLPGERSFNKPDVPTTLSGVSTIYHERPATSTSATASHSTASSGNVPERNSLLSSSSSHDASTATAASSSSSHNNNSNHNKQSNSTAATSTRSGGLFSGMLRHTTGRANRAPKSSQKESSTDDFNTSTSTTATAEADLLPIQQLYDNRSNMMSLSYAAQPHARAHHGPPSTQPPLFHSLHHIHHHNSNNNNNNSLRTAPHFYNTLESEVERRNRINAQLSRAPLPPVSTIFRERIHYPGSGRYPQAPFFGSNNSNSLLVSSMRARTNPRSMDRRHRIAAPVEHIEAAYGYAEPVYHENYHYESCGTPSSHQRLTQQQQQPLVYPAYIMPDYTSGSYRPHPASCSSSNGSTTYQNASQLYTRGGDSSFGSDSGYSHHTPASSIGRHDYDVALPMPASASVTTTTTPKATNKLATALSFGWNRRKASNSTPPTTLNVQHTNSSSPATEATTVTTINSVGNTGASSPNNNSGSSTVTTSLENSASTTGSGANTTLQNNNNSGSNMNNSCLAHSQPT